MGFVSSLFGSKNTFQSNPFYIDINGAQQQQGIGSAAGGPYQSAIQGALSGAPDFGQMGGQAFGQANANMNGLVQQLQDQANGQGPSLAQNQLKEGTDRTANLAAGAIASQRGINPALAARMITQQQANANQQAAGQSADLRMQEQMAARQQLANVLGQQMQGGLGAGGLGNQFLGTVGQLGQGQQQLSQQDYLNARNRGLEAAIANQRQQMTADQINAGVAGQNAQINGGIAGGILGGVGGFLGLAGGGKVPAMTPRDLTPADKATMGGDWGLDNPEKAPSPGSTRGVGHEALQTPQKMAMGGFAGGTPGFNSGLVSLGQALRHRMQAQQAVQPVMAQPGAPMGIGDVLRQSSFMAPAPHAPAPTAPMAAPMMGGGRVPGHAEVHGDSEKNDKVPALLSPGEVVIPRSKAKDGDKAKAFVEAIAKHDGSKEHEDAEGYGHVLARTRDLHERLKKIEHALGGAVY